MKMSEVSGRGSVPINGFADLFETLPVIVRNGMTFFRTGYVDTNVANYPQASQMPWLFPPADSTAGSFAAAQISQIEFRFSRFIIARSYAAGGGQFQIGSSPDFNTWADNTTATLTVQASSAPTLVWDGVGSALHCYVANHANRFNTTNGTAWTTTALSGLAGHVIDVVRLTSIWVALTSAGLYSSTDGITWTQRQAWAAAAVTDAGKLAVDGSGNIVAMLTGVAIYYTSTNGTSWTSRNCPANHTATGHVAFGDNKWQTAFRSTITNVTVAATSTDFINWTLGATAGFAGRYNASLGVWLDNPRSQANAAQSYSKDGLNWITTAASILGIGAWVVASGRTHGVRSSSGYFYNSASHLGNVVGLPYSLNTMAISANKYLRVR